MTRSICSTSVLLEGKQLGNPGALKTKGLKRVEVRLHRASRAGHDAAVGRVGEWKKVVASLRMAAEIPALQAGLRTPLTKEVVEDAAQFAKLLSLLPGVDWVLERPDDISEETAYRRVQRLASVASELGVSVSIAETWGDLDGPFKQHAQLASETILRLARTGGYWAAAGSPVVMPETGGDFYGYLRKGRSLGNLGFEFSIRGYPVVNLPPCLGGTGAREGASGVLYGAGCERCARRVGCHGIPKDLGMALTDDSEVEPLPLWTGMVDSPRVALVESGDAWLQRGLNGLRDVWQDMGARLVSTGEGADFVFFPSMAGAAAFLEDGGDALGRRMVVLDASPVSDADAFAARFDPNGRRHRGVDCWPGPEWVLLGTDPRRLPAYQAAGFPLRAIQFVHWALIPEFSGLPLSTGQVYRPQHWEGEEETRRAVTQADLVVLDRLDHSLERALAIAYGAGRTVIACSNGLTRWWVQDGQTGVLVRAPSDVDAAIQLYTDSPQRLARLTVNARKWSRAHSVRVLAEALFLGDKQRVDR